MSREKNVLCMCEVETFIGQYHILFGITLEVKKGKATVLLGRNGAGKTTTLESIIGLRPLSKGQIVFNEVDISKLKTHEIANLGIGYVPENRDIFTDLTIEENLTIACRNKKEYSKRLKLIFDLFPDMNKYYKKKSRILSGGQAQMLSISRALINDNGLILIDEPSKGLAPIIINNLIERLNQIKQKNTLLLVEQNYEMALSIGDYFYFIEDGKTVFGCDKETLKNDLSIRQKYLGI